MDRLRQDLSEAEAALSAARSAGGNEAEAIRAGMEREIRGLKARAEDQAGEIARLRAALSAFEQFDGKSINSLGNSKIALKAKLGSAQAQADQQASTITRLRAELAAAHERLARQAAHFMGEMRRIGAGSVPTSGQARRPQRRQRAAAGRAGLANHEDAAPCHRRECHGKRYNHDRCHRHGAGRACRRRAAQAGQQRSQRYYHCGSCGRWCNPDAGRETKFRGSCRRNAQSD